MEEGPGLTWAILVLRLCVFSIFCSTVRRRSFTEQTSRNRSRNSSRRDSLSVISRDRASGRLILCRIERTVPSVVPTTDAISAVFSSPAASNCRMRVDLLWDTTKRGAGDRAP